LQAASPYPRISGTYPVSNSLQIRTRILPYAPGWFYFIKTQHDGWPMKQFDPKLMAHGEAFSGANPIGSTPFISISKEQIN